MSQYSGRMLSTMITEWGSEESIRPASYDLKVGCITIDGTPQEDGAWLQPHSVAILTSLEEVKIPAGYVGYAFPKTSLCNKGIHVLNTGLIDPGYEGPLSSIALNFHKKENLIDRGDVFLRLVLHKLDTDEQDMNVRPVSKSSMVRENRERSKEFPNSFLDIPGQFESLAKRVTERSTAAFIWVLAVFTAIFALYTYFGPSMSQFVPGYWNADAQETRALKSEVEALRKELSELKRFIESGNGSSDELTHSNEDMTGVGGEARGGPQKGHENNE